MGNYQPIVPQHKRAIVQIVLFLVRESTLFGVKLSKFVKSSFKVSFGISGIFTRYRK